jgi:hypothetical protein
MMRWLNTWPTKAVLVLVLLGAWSYGTLTIARTQNDYNPYEMSILEMELDEIKASLSTLKAAVSASKSESKFVITGAADPPRDDDALRRINTRLDGLEALADDVRTLRSKLDALESDRFHKSIR